MLQRLSTLLSFLFVLGVVATACAPVVQPVYTGSIELTDQWVKLRSQTFEVAVEAPDTEGISSKVGLFCRPLASKKCPAHIDLKWFDVTTTMSRSVSWLEGSTSFSINISMPENGVVKVEWTSNLPNYEVGQVGGIVGNFAMAGSMVMTKNNSYSFTSSDNTLIITPLEQTDKGWHMDVKCIPVAVDCPESIMMGEVLVPNLTMPGWPAFGWNEELYANGQPTGEYLHIDLSFSVSEGGIEVRWSDGITPQ